MRWGVTEREPRPAKAIGPSVLNASDPASFFGDLVLNVRPECCKRGDGEERHNATNDGVLDEFAATGIANEVSEMFHNSVPLLKWVTERDQDKT